MTGRPSYEAEKWFSKGMEAAVSFLHEHDAINCMKCPAYHQCNDDCWNTIKEYIEEEHD